MIDVKPNIHLVDSDEEKITCAEIMSKLDPWITLGVSFDQMIQTLKDNINEVYAVFIKDEIVGIIIIQTRGAFSGYLKSIALKTEWRNKGFGKVMMNFFEEKAFSNGNNAFLCVSSFNKKAQKFYLNLGYRIIGELKDYVVEGYDEILMRKQRSDEL